MSESKDPNEAILQVIEKRIETFFEPGNHFEESLIEVVYDLIPQEFMDRSPEEDVSFHESVASSIYWIRYEICEAVKLISEKENLQLKDVNIMLTRAKVITMSIIKKCTVSRIGILEVTGDTTVFIEVKNALQGFINYEKKTDTRMQKI